MNECSIDHSHDDVRQKYVSQKEFLPEELHSKFDGFFQKEHTQEILNEVFHLLKKYDLVSGEEQEEKRRRLEMVLINLT